MQGSKVPVGVASLAGYSTSAVTLAGAAAAYLTGDRSTDTLIIILLGGYSAVSLVVTQVGRYAQAHAAVKGTPIVPLFPYGTPTPGVTPETPDGLPEDDSEFDPDPDPPSGPDDSLADPKLDSTGAHS